MPGRRPDTSEDPSASAHRETLLIALLGVIGAASIMIVGTTGATAFVAMMAALLAGFLLGALARLDRLASGRRGIVGMLVTVAWMAVAYILVVHGSFAAAAIAGAVVAIWLAPDSLLRRFAHPLAR